MAVGRSLGSFEKILAMRFFNWGEYFSKAGRNLMSEPMMLLMVWLWYSDSKGVLPVTILYMSTPTAQISTFSLYPPPVNISGARQQRVPVMVSMSNLAPLLRCFLHIPKSMSLSLAALESQRTFSSLMSLWTMARWCKQCMVSKICSATSLSCTSPSMLVKESGLASKYSMTSQQACFLRSIQSASYCMRFLCRRFLIRRKLLLRSGSCSSSNMKVLTANCCPLRRLMQRCTTPLDPSPSFSVISYFSAKISMCSKVGITDSSQFSTLWPSVERESDSVSACRLIFFSTMVLLRLSSGNPLSYVFNCRMRDSRCSSLWCLTRGGELLIIALTILKLLIRSQKKTVRAPKIGSFFIWGRRSGGR